MNRKLILISSVFILSLLLSSCGIAVKLIANVPNLKVYSQEQVSDNIKKLNVASNIIDVTPKTPMEEETIKNFLYMSFIYTPYIFDKKNRLLCLVNENNCIADNLAKIKLKNISESYEICDTTSYSHNILKFFNSYNSLMSKTTLSPTILTDEFDYKIIYFVNSDISKNELCSDWENIYNSFKNQNNVLFIRIWTDVNHTWGLRKNALVKTKVKKVKGSKREYEIVINKLPLVN